MAGLIQRPAEDVEPVFATSQDVTAFGLAVNQVTEHLREELAFQIEQKVGHRVGQILDRGVAGCQLLPAPAARLRR